MTDICILSGSTEKLTQVVVDGKNYHVSEDISDSCSLKALQEKIRAKVVAEQDNKSKLVSNVDDMAKGMGISREELIKMLGGNVGPAPAPVSTVDPTAVPTSEGRQVLKDDGFKRVPGDLATSIKAKVSADSKIPSAMPAYSSPTIDGKRIAESDKRIKVDGDTVISKSNMGTTVVRVTRNDGNRLSKALCEVDHEHNLVRGNITQDRECPVCRGTGMERVNHQECPKCQGIGFIV